MKKSGSWQSVLVIAGALFLAGLIVGAIHGRFLMVLVEKEQAEI